MNQPETPTAEALEKLCILVIGDNHYWGRAESLDEALRNAARPKRWVAYACVLDKVHVHEVDGSLSWETGYAPSIIARRGNKGPFGLMKGVA